VKEWYPEIFPALEITLETASNSPLDSDTIYFAAFQKDYEEFEGNVGQHRIMAAKQYLIPMA